MSRTLFALAMLLCSVTVVAAEGAVTYAPGKVVYDFSSPDPQMLNNILDRASALQNIYGGNSFDASIVIVIHEGAIPQFARGKPARDEATMRRVASLATGEVISFRVCAMSARMQGLGAEDFDKFVALVPMADAEIVRLQRDGYAYLR